MASTQHPNIPPPLPPPPRDLPEGYRAVTAGYYRPSTPADNPSPRPAHSRSASNDDRQALSPRPGSSTRRSGSIGSFLSRKTSRTFEVTVVTAPESPAMLRKQKPRDDSAPVPHSPTSPSYTPLQLHGFDAHLTNDSVAIVSNKASNFSRPYPPSPVMPAAAKQHLQSPISPTPDYPPRNSPSPSMKSTSEHLDTKPRADTVTGRYSTASGNVNSPRRVRRRKEPTPFNVLVMGAKGCGKTSLVNLLKTSLALPADKQSPQTPTPKTSFTSTDSSFTAHYVETEIENERVGVTLWDSNGLEKNLVDLQVRQTVAFIQSKFEDTFMEESKVMRSPAAKDSHIHCVLLLLDPLNLDNNLAMLKSHSNGNAFAQARGPAGLGEHLDLLVMKALTGRTTVLPVIGKADTLTAPHMTHLKTSVWNSIQAEKVNPLDFLNQDDSDTESDDETDPSTSLPDQTTDQDHTAPRQDDIYLPFTVLTPDPYGNTMVRTFPWGQADPFNPTHCDFVRLREAVFSEWRDDLRTSAREKGYEPWRTARLARREGRPVEISHIKGSTPATFSAF